MRSPLLGLMLVLTTLAAASAPVQAETARQVDEQAAIDLLSLELVPDELNQFKTLMIASSPEGRAALARLTLTLPQTERGAYALVLLDKTPDLARANIELLAQFNEGELLRFALSLELRKPGQWREIDGLLTAMTPKEAVYWIVDPDPGAICAVDWDEPVTETGDAEEEDAAEDETQPRVLGRRPAGQEIESGAPILPACNPAVSAFLRVWQIRKVKHVAIGDRAKPGEAPWQVQLLKAGASAMAQVSGKIDALDRVKYGRPRELWERDHVCGGSLLPGGWVLTAAHCIPQDWDAKQAAFFDGRAIRLGSRTIVEGGELRAIDAVVRHRRFASPEQGYDIALLRLAPQARSGSRAQEPAIAVNLPDAHRAVPGSAVPLWLSGWGYTGPTNDNDAARGLKGNLQVPSPWLNRATLYLRPPAECSAGGNINFQARRYNMVAGQLCIGSQTGRDSCRGDSGGPVVDLTGGRAVLLGIVSYGPGCGLAKTPGLYTDVRYFRDWIEGAKRHAVSGRITLWE